MDPDPNKKRDQNPQKPPIKVKQINIPENIRTLLNRGQGAGVRADTGPATGAATGAAAASLSTLDPFIKIVADSNRGIILMPVLSDVKFSIPSGSVNSFLGSSSSSLPDSSPSQGTQIQTQPNVYESTSYSQDKRSKTPTISSGSRSSLSFPNFSSLSKGSSAAVSTRDSAGNLTPSATRSNVQDFNISFPSDGKSSGFNISVSPREQISSSKSGSEEDRRRAHDISASSQEGLAISRAPSQGSIIGTPGYNIRQDDLSRAPSSEIDNRK